MAHSFPVLNPTVTACMFVFFLFDVFEQLFNYWPGEQPFMSVHLTRAINEINPLKWLVGLLYMIYLNTVF